MKASGSKRKRVVAILPEPPDFGTDAMTKRMIYRTRVLVIRSKLLLQKTADWRRVSKDKKSN